MSGVDTGDRETKIDPWFQAAENAGDPDEPRVREAVIGRLFGAAPDSGTPIKVDRYVLAQRVGTGGLGAVYEAWDPALGRKVAVKLLRSHGSAVAHNRLLREARAIARISHPNVVAVHDVGTYDAETIGGAPGEVGVFVVMELVDGQDMMAWSGTPRTWQEIVGAFARAGRGLVAAHAAGLVHRDFKPANVMIARDGRVFVLDFGLAQPAVDHSEGSSSAPVERERPLGEDQSSQGTPGRGVSVGDKLTEVGHVIGTPRYMSPEQHRGLPVDARSDQYSFCVAMWTILFDRPPFTGRRAIDLAIAKEAGRLPEPPPDRAPKWLLTVLERGLEPNPADRFPSMLELLDLLERGLGRRRRLFTAAGLALGLAIAVAGGIALGRSGGSTETPAADASSGQSDASLPPIYRRALAEGTTALNRQDFAEAQAHLDRAVASYPEGAEAHFYRAILFSWQEHPKTEVLAEIERAIEAGLDERQRTFMEAYRTYHAVSPVQALPMFRIASRRYPDDPNLMYGQLEALYHGGHPGEIVSLYQTMRKAAPEGTLGILHVLEYCAGQNDRMCIRDLLPIAAKQDDLFEAVWNARHEIAQGKLEAAASRLEGYVQSFGGKIWDERELQLLYMVMGRVDGLDVDEPHYDGMPALAKAYASGDEAAIAVARTNAARIAEEPVAEGSSVSRARALETLLVELPTQTSPIIPSLCGRLHAIADAQGTDQDTQLVLTLCDATLGDETALAEHAESDYAEVRIVASALQLRAQRKHGDEAQAWREAIPWATRARTANVERFELARALHLHGDDDALILACDAVLQPGQITWAWATSAPQCKAWRDEAIARRGPSH